MRWVRVAFARYPPEAEMLANMLAELDIPVMVRRATVDVPDMLAGGPREVTDKILYEHDLFGHQRFLAQMSVGGIPHDKVMRSIELFATEVAPVVRAEVARREAEAPAGTPTTA